MFTTVLTLTLLIVMSVNFIKKRRKILEDRRKKKYEKS